jgi:hypothetical protein
MVSRQLASSAAGLAAFSLVVAGGCSDRGPREIDTVRLLPEDGREVLVVDSGPERYRMSSAAEQTQEGNEELPFTWETPEGWSRMPKMAMRDLTFTFGANGEGECYLSRLPGAGGGLAANVNRWRQQMGLEPASEGDIAALPKRDLFGMEAVYVSLDGEFRGMNAAESKKDFRMVGVILAADFGAIFIKMVGPRELVDANTQKFEAFCASLKPRA